MVKGPWLLTLSYTSYFMILSQIWYTKFRHNNVQYNILLHRVKETLNLQKTNNSMTTSSNGNIFHVTGPLCGDFTGHRWIPAQRPVTRSFDVFFDLRLNKRLSKQSRRRWFETPSHSLWRICSELIPRWGVLCVFKITFDRILRRSHCNSYRTKQIKHC